MNELINQAMHQLMNLLDERLMPFMVLVFFGGAAMRFLINYTIKREEWFVSAFQKRAYEYLEGVPDGMRHSSFYVTAKVLLEKTYYELFVMRAILKRRNNDVILDKSDRIFLVQPGCARLVQDTLKHVKFCRYDIHRPNTLNIAANILEKNPYFNRVFGIFPVGTFNDLLNTLPPLFIVGGIFGTFIGIMGALPQLGGMDLADIDKTKQIMDFFLVKMAGSMVTSILGIFLSVCMTFVNSIFDSERIFIRIVEKYEDSIDTLWNSCSDNILPKNIKNFDEHRDPLEALAEDAVKKELIKNKDYVEEKTTLSETEEEPPALDKKAA